jgi:hypothetical protein
MGWFAISNYGRHLMELLVDMDFDTISNIYRWICSSLFDLVFPNEVVLRRCMQLFAITKPRTMNRARPSCDVIEYQRRFSSERMSSHELPRLLPIRDKRKISGSQRYKRCSLSCSCWASNSSFEGLNSSWRKEIAHSVACYWIERKKLCYRSWDVRTQLSAYHEHQQGQTTDYIIPLNRFRLVEKVIEKDRYHRAPQHPHQLMLYRHGRKQRGHDTTSNEKERRSQLRKIETWHETFFSRQLDSKASFWWD